MGDLFIAKLPALGNVEVFEAELVTISCDNRRGGPVLQLLKSKCRELARNESSLLVSPTTAALHTPFGARPPMTLWIMAKAGCIDNPKLQNKLKHLEMKVLRQMGMSEVVLQTCYQFSLTARLAPKWNLLTSWMVQGLEFLTTGRAHAVVLQIGVTRTEITLSVNVSRLTFNFLQPSDLGVSITTLSCFTTDPHSVIMENSISNNRCTLMPNLTVGYVYSVSHQLPSSTEFPTYDSVRLHWKKQHGMILPDKQNLFFQVFFKSNPQTFFSYPGCCVLKAPPLASSSRDARTVASAFIADVHARLPTLCGDTIRYSNKALTPFNHLITAAQPSAYPNVRLATVPSRPASTSRSAGPKSQSCNNDRGLSLIGRVSAAMASTPSNHMTTPYDHHIQTVPDTGSHTQSNARRGTQASNTRTVPVFKPSHYSSQLPAKATTTKSAPVTTIKPSFKPTTSHHTLQTVPKSFAMQSSSSSIQNGKQGQKHTLTNGSRPPATKRARMSTQNASFLTKTDRGDAKGNRDGCSAQNDTTCASEQLVPQLYPRHIPDGPSIDTDQLQDRPGQQLHSSTTNHSAGHTTQKKGKGVKTTIHVDGVNPEIMTRISKVKAPVLRRWLQEQGVKCPSRRTKENMIRMAAQYIRDTGNAFTIPSN